ncbi:MAG TPA: STAS domain-containing protein [Candidatus Ozemobacteraceae bacterium]|nr:STAS domain-containing protein [Candidatus Ozemobacteraceae bacterium]
MNLQITQEQHGQVNILVITGRLDSTNSESFETLLTNLINAGTSQILIDGTQMAYISSAGLRILLMIAKQLNRTRGRIVLCGLNESVKKVFDLTGLTGIFPLCATREEGLKSF